MWLNTWEKGWDASPSGSGDGEERRKSGYKYLMGEDRKWRANGGYRRAEPRKRNKPREGHREHPISQRGDGSARWENGGTFRSVGLTDLDARGANRRDGTHLPTSAAIGEPFDGGLGGGGQFPRRERFTSNRRTVWRAPIGLSDRVATPSMAKSIILTVATLFSLEWAMGTPHRVQKISIQRLI